MKLQPTFDHDPTVGKAANASTYICHFSCGYPSHTPPVVDTMATRGQDPYVGPKLGKFLTKAGCHVLETVKRPIDMSKYSVPGSTTLHPPLTLLFV